MHLDSDNEINELFYGNNDRGFTLYCLFGRKLLRCGCGMAKERDMQRQCGKESTRDRWQISSRAIIMRTIRE